MVKEDRATAVGGSAGTPPQDAGSRDVSAMSVVPTAQQIEDAMTEAVMQCAREGITDPATILQRKLDARALVTGE